MTHRNNPSLNDAALTSSAVSLRARVASKLSYLVFVVVLITITPGAGFGHV